jgi:hypothetical protein
MTGVKNQREMALVFLRLLLFTSVMVSTVFLYYSIFLTDACYTDPCLSSDFSVNFLRVSVSASVTAVVFGAVGVLAPSGALYLLYTNCKAFTGGCLSGVYIVISLAAWLQAITWGEQYSNMYNISSESIKMFGSIYTLNAALRRNSLTMCILCAVSAFLNTALCLSLLRLRRLYCVDLYEGSRSRVAGHAYNQYQTISTTENRDIDDRREDDVSP